MLSSHEELYPIELDSMTTKLLNKANGGPRKDKTVAITYPIPFNCAC